MPKCSINYRRAWDKVYYLVTAKGYKPRLAVEEAAERYPLNDEEYYNLHRDFLSYPNHAIESYK